MRGLSRIVAFALAPVAALLLSACDVLALSFAAPSPDSGSTSISTTDFEKQVDESYLYATNDSANRGKTFFITNTNLVSGAYTYEVSVQKNSGGASGGFGIVFRWLDNSNFWFVDIDTQGYYCVGEVQDGNITYATNQNNVTWTSCQALSPGYGLSNSIKLIFDGSSNYELRFNGQSAMNFADSNNSPGYLGFNAAVLSTENFPSVPVSVSFTLRSPSTLIFAALRGGLPAAIRGRL